MITSNKIEPNKSGFEDFKSFVVNEAKLHPILAIALAIFFPVGIVVVTCAWGVHKAKVAAKTKELEKADAAASAQFEKQKEYLMFGAKVLGALALGGLTISAYYYFSGETVKQAAKIVSEAIPKNENIIPKLPTKLPTNAPEIAKTSVKKLVSNFTNPFQSPVSPTSIFQNDSNITSTISNKISSTMFPSVSNLTPTTTPTITTITIKELVSKTVPPFIYDKGIISTIPIAPLQTPSNYFNMTDLVSKGKYLLDAAFTTCQYLSEVTNSALNIISVPLSSAASVSRSTYQMFTTQSEIMKTLVQPVFIPLDMIGSLLNFKPVKWSLLGLIIYKREDIQTKINSYSYAQNIADNLWKIDRYTKKLICWVPKTPSSN